MQEVRIGIVGMGNRGRWWISLLERIKGAKIAALCEKVSPLLEQGLASAQNPEIQGYQDFTKMLQEAELDAVAIVVEPNNNADLVCEALYSGKHAICDVPLAFTLEDCWKIVVAVEKSGRKFKMAEQIRFSPYVSAWKKMVEEGTLGKIIFAEGQYFHGMPSERFWFDTKTGQGLTWEAAKNNPDAEKSRLWDMPNPILYLPHELSPLLKILDDRVTKVVSMGTRRSSYVYEGFPVPDIEVALMHTEKDTILRMAAGFNVPSPRPNHWQHLMGTCGEVETNRSENEKMKIWLADNYMCTKEDVDWTYTAYQQAPPEAAGSGHGNLDYYPPADFIQSILQDTSLDMDVYQAAETAAPAILAAVSADNNNKLIDIPDFRPTKKRPAGCEPEKEL